MGRERCEAIEDSNTLDAFRSNPYGVYKSSILAIPEVVRRRWGKMLPNRDLIPWDEGFHPNDLRGGFAGVASIETIASSGIPCNLY